MKSLFASFFFLATATASAQITITDNDLPEAEDVYTLSVGDPASVDLNELDLTGPNTNWNFNIQYSGQASDTMFGIFDVPTVYFLTFASTDFATHQQEGFSLPIPIPGFSFSVTDIYNFFNLTSSKMEQVGMGARVNGINVPIIFEPNDKVYSLPLTYQSEFTSDAFFTASVPGFGTWAQTRHRETVVDGWGTLDGPLGLKEVLRVKSTVDYVDSIGVSTQFGDFGYPFPHTETEYKWLSLDGGAPLLQITVNETLGMITQIRYQDLPTAIHFVSNPKRSLLAYPQPAAALVTVINPFAESGNVTLSLRDVTGRLLRTDVLKPAALLNFDVSDFPAGVYAMTLQANDEIFTSPIAVTR